MKKEIVVIVGMNTINSRDELLLTEILLPNLRETIFISDKYIVNNGFILFKEEKDCWDKILKKEGFTYDNIIKVEYQIGLRCPYHLGRGSKLSFIKPSKEFGKVDGYAIILTVYK